MGRGVVVALVLATGCVGPAQSVGAIDEDATEGIGVSAGGASTGISTSSSSGEDPEGGTTTAGSGCETPCVAYHDCQQSRCLAGECMLSFRDDLCEPGEVCGPSGCEVAPLDCDAPTVLVCEDFETDGFSPQWTGGAVGRTQADAHSGAFAGEISVDPDEREQLQLQVDPPISEGLLALRAFVRLPETPVVTDWVILYELFGRMNAGAERYSLDFTQMYGLQYVALPGVMSGPPNPGAIPPNVWVCVELRIQISDTEGSLEVRVNDVVVDGSDVPVDTLPVDGFANIEVGGLGSPRHTEAYPFLIDDVVVATVPIGCGVD